MPTDTGEEVEAAGLLDTCRAGAADPLLAREVASLHHRGDNGREAAYPLEGRRRTLIGRTSACDLILRDDRVSRLHASIELIEDHCLLRDEGSSNGTFLNGLRLSPDSAFSLRRGDVIELGSQRFVFGGSSPTETSPAAVQATTFPGQELTREGYASLDLLERRELQVAVQRAFEGVPRLTGIDRCLAIATDRLGGHSAALFMDDATGRLRTVAARPVIGAADPLAHLVQQAFSTRLVHVLENTAAIPLFVGPEPHGVLALEWPASKKPARAKLAFLAAVADRIAAALAVQGKNAGDTRPGYGG